MCGTFQNGKKRTECSPDICYYREGLPVGINKLTNVRTSRVFKSILTENERDIRTLLVRKITFLKMNTKDTRKENDNQKEKRD